MPQIQWNTVKNILLIITIALLVYLTYQLRTVKRELSNVNELNTVLNDTLVIRKSKEGLFVAKIGVLESYKQETFTKMASQDSVINKLQKLVVQYKTELKKKGSVTVIGTQGTVDVVVSTIMDTTSKDYIYNSSFNLKGWVWGEVSASKDSTKISVKFKEEIDAIIGEEKTGFLGLGKRKMFVDVILHNPYNEVKYLRSYSTKQLPAKKFSVGPTAVYGIGKGLEPNVFIGLGVTYSIFRF